MPVTRLSLIETDNILFDDRDARMTVYRFPTKFVSSLLRNTYRISHCTYEHTKNTYVYSALFSAKYPHNMISRHRHLMN